MADTIHGLDPKVTGKLLKQWFERDMEDLALTEFFIKHGRFPTKSEALEICQSLKKAGIS